MTKLRDLSGLVHYRVKYQGGDAGNGVFRIPSCVAGMLGVIASNTGGWDHVSVSLTRRTPTWAEMEYVKRLFFQDDATCAQFHVPPDQHINLHPHCLHIWSPQQVELPRPPQEMV